MIEADFFEQLRLFLPKYLSPSRQQDLWRELRAFPHNRTIYSDIAESLFLQGDGWRGFIAIDFHSRQGKPVSGLILSNSCDISSENKRALIPNITFAPLMRLERYALALRSGGMSDEALGHMVAALRKQEITSLMYFPAKHDVMPESVAIFDDIRGHPSDDFVARDRSRLFRLSDFGFYLLLLKLSIHFTRMLEAVER